MKTIFQLFLIILLFEFSDVKAQQSDSTARLPLMKSKSQIFIAEVKTNVGITKGILYDANEREVIILDSVYQKVILQVTNIKSIVLRRSNALWYGFKTGFKITEFFVIAFALPFLLSDVPAWGGVIFILGTGYALFAGGVFLLLSGIPSMSVDINTPQDYIKKLGPLHRHSQVYLLKKNAPKLRMRT